MALSVENMAEEPSWQGVVNDANAIINEAEEYASKHGLNFPSDLIWKLIKVAKELHAERGAASLEVGPVLTKIKALFEDRVTHDCAGSQFVECAICKGIEEVLEL